MYMCMLYYVALKIMFKQCNIIADQKNTEAYDIVHY